MSTHHIFRSVLHLCHGQGCRVFGWMGDLQPLMTGILIMGPYRGPYYWVDEFIPYYMEIMGVDRPWHIWIKRPRWFLPCCWNQRLEKTRFSRFGGPFFFFPSTNRNPPLCLQIFLKHTNCLMVSNWGLKSSTTLCFWRIHYLAKNQIHYFH